MSYLRHCNRVKQSSDAAWRVQWRSTRGTIYLAPYGDETSGYHATIYYPRHSKLGELLTRNAEGERKFIADAIEERCGVRPTAWIGR